MKILGIEIPRVISEGVRELVVNIGAHKLIDITEVKRVEEKHGKGRLVVKAFLYHDVLRDADGEDVAAFEKRIKEREQCIPPYKPGDENTLWSVLGALYEELDKPEHHARRLSLFADIVRSAADQATFDAHIASLDHNWIEQGIARVDHEIDAALGEVETWLDGMGVR